LCCRPPGPFTPSRNRISCRTFVLTVGVSLAIQEMRGTDARCLCCAALTPAMRRLSMSRCVMRRFECPHRPCLLLRITKAVYKMFFRISLLISSGSICCTSHVPLLQVRSRGILRGCVAGGVETEDACANICKIAALAGVAEPSGHHRRAAGGGRRRGRPGRRVRMVRVVRCKRWLDGIG